MKNLSIAFILSAMLFIMFNQSCTKEQDPVAPQLPPEETFIMDFTGFDSNDTDRTFTNWYFSATNVLYWNAVVTIGLAVPVTAFAESFNHEPVYQGDLTWLWTYSIVANGVTYTAKLYGKKLSDSENQWDMYISKQNGYTDFHWYTGTVKTDHSEAQWILYKNVMDTPTDFVRIDFEKDFTAGTSQITYTNIEPNGTENGGYISYGIQLDYYDGYYDIYNKGEENLTEIESNRTTKEGRVRDLKRFEDHDWHCWNELLMDSVCP